MKNIYIIGGTMGIGKTTVSKQLMKLLPDAVFLDGDWCWQADPFQVTTETKAMVMDNICYLLNNFIRCQAYSNVIFCWVMHKQEIIDEIFLRLDTENHRVHAISLVADEEALTARLMKDVTAGERQQDVIERSIARIPLYKSLDTIKIDVSRLSPDEAAQIIAEL